MQNNFFDKISNTIKFFILLLILITLLISKSLYLILVFTILTFIFIIISDCNVKTYINFTRKFLFVFLILFIIYFILHKNLFLLVIFIYKIILVIIIAVSMFYNIKFTELNNSLYTILYPIEKRNKNIKKISFNLTCDLLFIKKFFDYKLYVYNMKNTYNLCRFNLINYIFSRIIWATKETKLISYTISSKFYMPEKETINNKSKFLLIIFILIFVIALLKEVI